LINRFWKLPIKPPKFVRNVSEGMISASANIFPKTNDEKPLLSFDKSLLATGLVELLNPFATVPANPPPSSKIGIRDL